MSSGLRARVVAVRARLQEVAQARVHPLVQRLLEALLGAEQRVDGARARAGLPGDRSHRDRLEAPRRGQVLGRLQQPRARGVVVLPGPSHPGEVPIAFVVADGPADPGELLSFAGARLASYKRPRDVILVDRLPRTPAGKLLRRELRGLARPAHA